jgi:hypothetical protein
MDSTALPGSKKFWALLALIVFAFTTFAAAQNSQSSSNTQSSGASTESAKAAPQKAAPENSDRGLVEGAQDQIKKLQNYMNPPPAPKDMGKPDVKVWADLHTALYYCPGSKQYGHTAKGKYMTQKEAQDSNFEPEPRVPCPAGAPAPEKKTVAKNSKSAAKKTPSSAPASKQQN